MKVLLATALAVGTVSPALADHYQPGYSYNRTCTRTEYREEYVPGTRNSPGYVRNWEETIDVPCRSNQWHPRPSRPPYREPVIRREHVPSPDGMLYKNQIVKVTEWNDKTKKIRVTDNLGKIWWVEPTHISCSFL